MRKAGALTANEREDQNKNLETQRDGAATKTRIKTLKRRGSRGSRGFWGYCRELSNNLTGDEKGWANATTPKNLCFLCYLCVSRFRVLTFDLLQNPRTSGPQLSQNLLLDLRAILIDGVDEPHIAGAIAGNRRGDFEVLKEGEHLPLCAVL